MLLNGADNHHYRNSVTLVFVVRQGKKMLTEEGPWTLEISLFLKDLIFHRFCGDPSSTSK